MQFNFLSMHVVAHNHCFYSKSSFGQNKNEYFAEIFEHNKIFLIKINVFIINKSIK
jgi:hypothetical protein